MRAGISQKAFVLNEAGAALIYAQGEINSVMGGPALESVFDYSDAKFMWPSNMFAVGGRMMINTATAINETESSMASKNERAEAESDLIADLMNRLIPVGLQKIGDSSAIHYQATDMQASAPPNDNSGFVPTSASIWIDIDKYVVIKHRIDGVATADGTTGEYYIEVENSDFRSPIGCGAMYEPYRRATRMGGILNDQQMAEMQDARLQLEDYDNQMASLPADQRAMMEDMMGDQMNTLRGLADNGAMEYVEEIEEVFCNPDLKVLFGRTEAPSSEDLLQQIQVHLVALGYEPGNTDGILDMMTQVAISQFQAEHGLAVTGEPNQILAVALANEVKELGA